MQFLRCLKKCFLCKNKKYPITLYPKIKPIGRVLFSYLADPLLWKDNDVRFLGHSNNWESREIARIFTELGFIVDAINYNDISFYPVHDYDLIFDIHYNLQRLMPFLNTKTIKILHITGSYPRFSVKAELKRVNELEKRKKCYYSPKRIVDIELFDRSLCFSDACSLIGNDIVLNTFPKEFHDKITKVTVSASELRYIKKEKDYAPIEKEFLWFFGGGAVHKGLDLVLDFFVKNTKYKLNIIGNVESEKDFFKIYKRELEEFPNIKYNGFLYPSDNKFKEIVDKCFSFIAPSCSEAISTAVSTVLQIGLFPIISKNTGIDLPKDCGIYLEDLSYESLEKAINNFNNINKKDLIAQITRCQDMALKKYSRNAFSIKMKSFIEQTLKIKGFV